MRGRRANRRTRGAASRDGTRGRRPQGERDLVGPLGRPRSTRTSCRGAKRRNPSDDRLRAGLVRVGGARGAHARWGDVLSREAEREPIDRLAGDPQAAAPRESDDRKKGDRSREIPERVSAGWGQDRRRGRRRAQAVGRGAVRAGAVRGRAIHGRAIHGGAKSQNAVDLDPRGVEFDGDCHARLSTVPSRPASGGGAVTGAALHWVCRAPSRPISLRPSCGPSQVLGRPGSFPSLAYPLSLGSPVSRIPCLSDPLSLGSPVSQIPSRSTPAGAAQPPGGGTTGGRGNEPVRAAAYSSESLGLDFERAELTGLGESSSPVNSARER